MDPALTHVNASNANSAAHLEKMLRRLATLPRSVRNPGNKKCGCGRTISVNATACLACAQFSV